MHGFICVLLLSIGMTHVFTFMPVECCFDYYNMAVYLEVLKLDYVMDLVLLFTQDVFDYF